ncbi:MAG: hydroxypyruvate isomerase family protein [bacterium]
MPKSEMTRRAALASLAGAAAGAVLVQGSPAGAQDKPKLKGRIKQSVSRWCYDSVMDWEPFAKACAEMGLVGIDLVDPKFWPIVKDHGLVATMVPGAGSIGDGLNDKRFHAKAMEDFKKNIKAAADFGWPNVITFSGNRRGTSDYQAWDNCCEILKEAVKIAEDHNVTINMELLNSKVDHRDYQCDHTLWGVELCQRVGSPRLKLLYDIYHMQIMEGDLIRTIRENIDYIGHFHTGGNPGRLDLDETQEINYAAVMNAIAELQDQGKYKGYVAHEFIPKKGMESLRHAVMLCDV